MAFLRDCRIPATYFSTTPRTRYNNMTLQRFQQFLWSEDGPTSVEYAVLLALIAAAVIGAVLSMSNATADSFDNSAAQLSGSLGS